MISYGKGEAWNDMMISSSQCLVMKLLRNLEVEYIICEVKC